MIHVQPLAIPEVKLLSPRVFRDARGSFQEVHRRDHFAESGIDATFVQDNWSRSCRNVLRGMHYQLRSPQAKLVTVVHGSIFDVAVDIRLGSPTFGRWVGEILSDENRRQMLVPPGFAHGFYVLSDEADVFYKCSNLYDPTDDLGILWSDPGVAIAWSVVNPIVSPRDARLPPLREVPAGKLPTV